MARRIDNDRLDAATAAGRDFFKSHPEAMLVVAWREAAQRYGASQQVWAFCEGFSRARLQRDDYLRERRVR